MPAVERAPKRAARAEAPTSRPVLVGPLPVGKKNGPATVRYHGLPSWHLTQHKERAKSAIRGNRRERLARHTAGGYGCAYRWDAFQFEFVFRLVRFTVRYSSFCPLSTCLSLSLHSPLFAVRVCPDFIYLLTHVSRRIKINSKVVAIEKCVEKAPKRRERVGTAQKEIRKKQCKVRVCVYVCVRVCECVSFPSLPLQKQKSIFQIHDNYPRPKQQKFNNQLRFSRLFF